MKRLIVIALFLNAFFLVGRLLQEANVDAGAPSPSRNGDVNCDGALDISDAVGILQFLFNGGREPCAFAVDDGLSVRVSSLERDLAGLQQERLAQRAASGALSIADLGLSRKCLDTDIASRLSEIYAVATAGSDVTVKTETAFEFLDELAEALGAVEPIPLLSARSLRRPERIARETDAAVEALNAWIDEVNGAFGDTLGGYPRLVAEIALAQSTGRDVEASDFLDAMVAANLESLREVASGDAFRKAEETMSALVEVWEEKLSALGDDAQLANSDFQNMLQKMQQTLQTISNVSKLIHDTAMAVIRKIG